VFSVTSSRVELRDVEVVDLVLEICYFGGVRCDTFLRRLCFLTFGFAVALCVARA
jgi:hypothetical protein